MCVFSLSLLTGWDTRMHLLSSSFFSHSCVEVHKHSSNSRASMSSTCNCKQGYAGLAVTSLSLLTGWDTRVQLLSPSKCPPFSSTTTSLSDHLKPLFFTLTKGLQTHPHSHELDFTHIAIHLLIVGQLRQHSSARAHSCDYVGQGKGSW